MKNRSILFIFGLVWLFAVTFGLHVLLAYENTPGVAAAASSQWPRKSSLRPATDRATLIILAHPQCPCTRATIGELNGLMAECQGKVKVYVLFYKPKAFAAGWEKTDLWWSATAIPGVTALCDEDGLEASRFDATTSGQTFLFDKNGHLLFSGGITGARGHAGDNAGRDAVVSLLNTGKAAHDKTPVFGCSVRSF